MATEQDRQGGVALAQRRITVLLGCSSSSGRILESLGPLIERGEGVELSAVFVEESEVEIAARLPFVREICALTSEVREFRASDAAMTRDRSIRKARGHIELAAAGTRFAHSFSTVRGTMRRVLEETVAAADVTFFEPMGAALRARFRAQETGPVLRRPVAVLLTSPESGASAVRAGFELARRKPENVALLLPPGMEVDGAALERMLKTGLPLERMRIETLADPSIPSVLPAVRRLGAQCLVVSVAKDLLAEDALGTLSAELRCPLLLVRQWH